LLPPAEDPAVLEAVAGPTAEPIATSTPRRVPLIWWLSLSVIVVDQIAKALVRATLPLYDSQTVIPGLMDLTHVRNAGVAFGLMNDAAISAPIKAVATTGMAALALVGIGMYARHITQEERLARVGLSLILGGALGNLIDRLRQGFVIDFVDVYFRGWHFWAFNVADASITIGAILVFLDLLVVTRHASHPLSDR
jgi:signal peptidase II